MKSTSLSAALDRAIDILAASPTPEATKLAFRYRVGRLTLQDFRTIAQTVALLGPR